MTHNNGVTMIIRKFNESLTSSSKSRNVSWKLSSLSISSDDFLLQIETCTATRELSRFRTVTPVRPRGSFHLGESENLYTLFCGSLCVTMPVYSSHGILNPYSSAVRLHFRLLLARVTLPIAGCDNQCNWYRNNGNCDISDLKHR